MAYKHILIAVDLSPESKVLVEKAVSMARPYNAKVSLIHVDVNYSDLYTGLIDVNLGDMQKRISEETHHALTELSTNAGYPITETLSGSGETLTISLGSQSIEAALPEGVQAETLEHLWTGAFVSWSEAGGVLWLEDQPSLYPEDSALASVVSLAVLSARISLSDGRFTLSDMTLQSKLS